MSLPASCCTSSCSPQVTEIPGAQGATGAAGSDGTDGINAFTTLTSNLTIPAVGASVSVTVADNSWMVVGQTVFAGDGVDKGTFSVASKTGSTQVSLTFLNAQGDSSVGAVIGSGGTVSPSGRVANLAVPLPVGIPDNTTGDNNVAALAAGVGVQTLVHPLTSLATGLGVLAIDLMTTWTPGFKFKILSWDFITTVAGTGAGASQTFNLEIGTTNVTGGLLNVTLASTAAIGQVTPGAPVTGNNTGSASDSISIEMAAGGTVFTAGAGYFVIRVQNMDVADAVASMNASISQLILALS